MKGRGRTNQSKKWALSGVLASALALACSIYCSSCATMFSSNSCVLQMNSDPPGATYIYGPFSGKTPASISVPKKEIANYATFTMNGYRSQTVAVPTGITGVFWLNLIVWPGMLVDLGTGDYQTVKVSTISAELTPASPASAASSAPPVGTVPAIPASPAPSE